MYQDRIHRITPNRHPQFFIRRSEIAFDERLAFVESVLATLNESRFGPGSVYQFLKSSDRPELEPEPLYDFSGDEPNRLVPYYSLPSLGRAGYQVVETACRRAKQMGFVDTLPNAQLHGGISSTALAPNQGRGSP